MRLTMGVRSVLRCERLSQRNVNFYISALLGVIIKVILQNARFNNKDRYYMFRLHFL